MIFVDLKQQQRERILAHIAVNDKSFTDKPRRQCCVCHRFFVFGMWMYMPWDGQTSKTSHGLCCDHKNMRREKLFQTPIKEAVCL